MVAFTWRTGLGLLKRRERKAYSTMRHSLDDRADVSQEEQKRGLRVMG